MQDSAGANATTSINPATGETLSVWPLADAAQIERSVEAAWRAAQSWGRCPVETRAQLLRALAAQLRAHKAALARDTVFAAVLLVCNGVVGMCLLAGGVQHRAQGFQLQGASGALAVLTALTWLALLISW